MNGGKPDCAPFERRGRALAVVEAKRASVGEAQGQRYDDLLDVPFIFLSNGKVVWFRDKTACIDVLCREMAAGRRKLLVEMAGYCP